MAHKLHHWSRFISHKKKGNTQRESGDIIVWNVEKVGREEEQPVENRATGERVEVSQLRVNHSFEFSVQGGGRKEQLATGKRSLKIRLQLWNTYEFIHCLCEYLFVGAAMVHAQVHVCLYKCVPSIHGSGVTLPALRMLHSQKGEQSSYLCFWSEKHRTGSLHVAHILAFFASPHSACPSRLSAPRAYVIYGELTLPVYECA